MSPLIHRLEMYWQMELVSSALIPLVYGLLLLVSGNSLGWFAFACYLPAFLLLLVGARYWYAKLAFLNGDPLPLKKLLPIALLLRGPLLILSLIALSLCVIDLFYSMSVNSFDRTGGVLFSMLALLEFTNYYLFQLQHFDHWPDFARLLSGNGFRKSHLRRDIQQWIDTHAG